VFTINTADSPPYSTELNTGLYDRIIKKTFTNLGIQIKINHLPSARSIENVDIGLDNGEYARIKGLSERYKNLVIVDEKLIDFAFTAFSKDSKIRIDGWDTLKNYNVCFMRGWKIFEMNVKGTQSLNIVSSVDEMFGMLLNDRVDIILYEKLRGYDFLKKNNIKGISALKKPLSVRGMYFYINRSNRLLVPKIEKELRRLKENGEYDAVLSDFI